MKRSTGRALFTAAFLATGLVWSGTASASTVTYDLTLSPVPFTGSVGGMGSLTLNNWVSTPGWQTFHDSDVQSFTMTIGSHTFDLKNHFVKIVFDGGNLEGVFGFGHEQNDNDAGLLAGSLFGGIPTLFVAAWDGFRFHSFDFISSAVDPAPSATPLPSTWSLMLVGFAALGFAGYRARRNPALAAA